MAKYEKLKPFEDEEQFGEDIDPQIRPQHHTPFRLWLQTWSWTVHLVFVAVYFATALSNIQNPPVGRFWGLENIYEDAPRGFETVTFKRAGFHGPTSPSLTPFEGAPNTKNNASWDHVMEVGVIGISKSEADRLPVATTESPGAPGRYIVQLEMFHQLHCLKQLRKQLWEFEYGIVNRDEASQRQQHFDHCIDYLRQVVMCHGDLTPVTFEWNEERKLYLAHHGTIHQCRSFDAIYDWAKSRNNVGIATDGEHKNYDGAAHGDPAPN